MTMLFGWASRKERYPLSQVGEAFNKGAVLLDNADRRMIVQGDGGTVFGLSVAARTKEVSGKHPLRNKEKINLPDEVGNAVRIDRMREVSNLTWFSIRGRFTKPESILEVLSILDLQGVHVAGAFGIITRRSTALETKHVDRTAPTEALPSFVGGTVGYITDMVTELEHLGIQPGTMDGRRLLQKLHQDITPHGHSGYYHAAAMAERVFLLRNYAHLPYSLHWVLLDPVLDFAHALHSEERNGGHREKPYLSIGKNMRTSTVVFASEAGMMDEGFGTLNIKSPREGEIFTMFTDSI